MQISEKLAQIELLEAKLETIEKMHCQIHRRTKGEDFICKSVFCSVYRNKRKIVKKIAEL